MSDLIKCDISRRALVKAIMGGIALTAASPLLSSRVLAAEADCQSLWNGFKIFGDVITEIGKGLGAIAAAAKSGVGPAATDSVAKQTLTVAKSMASIKGLGAAKGAVAVGVISQQSYILSQLKTLGVQQAQAKLDFANKAIASGNYAAVANDGVLGPIVKAGFNSYNGFVTALKNTGAAMQTMEQNNLTLFAKQASEARSKKQLSDAQIDGLMKLYGNHKGILAVLQKIKSIPTASLNPDSIVAPAVTGLAAMDISREAGAWIQCDPCAGSDETASDIGDRLLELIGIRKANAVEPATVIIVIAVIATVAFVATLWTYIKCVQTTEQPDRFTDCMNNAMNVYNQALATAEQHRQNCLRTCAFGICTPAFICDGAKATEVAAATAILWASQAVCYAVA